MKINKNTKKAFVLAGLLFFPSLLFYLFLFTGTHRVKRLPFYGPREIIQQEFRGKIIEDTTYYEIPAFNWNLHNGDTMGHLSLEGKIWITHYLPIDTLQSAGVFIPKTIIYAAKEALLADSSILFITQFRGYIPGTEVPKPESYTPAFMGNSHRWLFVTGPDSIVEQTGQAYIFPEWTFQSAPPDPLSLVLIDKERRIRGYYNPLKAADISRMKEDIGMLIREYSLDYRTHRHFDYNPKLEKRNP